MFVPNTMADQLLRGMMEQQMHAWMQQMFPGPLVTFSVENAQHPPGIVHIEDDDEVHGSSSSSRPWRS